MSVSFDRIVIAVPNMSAAISEYAALFGSAPRLLEESGDDAVAWLALSNTVLELVERPGAEAGVEGLVLATEEGAPGLQPIPNTLGLSISQCSGQQTASFRQKSTETEPTLAVDHVVLRTNNAEACIELFRDTLGIRLALDKTAPQWGGRMLFFRAGKLTLEVIASDDPKSEKEENAFWGIAFKCPELFSLHEELAERGVEVSDVREGRKPGTQVATLKSHCLGIPTLLLQPAPAG